MVYFLQMYFQLGFVFTFCLFVGISGAPNRTNFDLGCVSWNVNGAAKLSSLTPVLGFLERFDVVMLQETYTTSPENGFELEGFIPYHVLARVTRSKPSCGLTTLLKINTFVGGTLKPLPCPADWFQVIRWRSSSDRGILFINVYFAVHTTGFDASDARLAISFLTTLRSDYPGDSMFLGGDLNYDPWRTQEQRNSKITIPAKTRYLGFMLLFFNL
jgi:exonuclease III